MVFLQKFKVVGHSMSPLVKPGREILVSSLPYLFFKPKAGDMIAFKDGNKSIIKRIIKADEDKFLVTGDNKEDSKKYGWIERKRIIGKVIYPWAVKI